MVARARTKCGPQRGYVPQELPRSPNHLRSHLFSTDLLVRVLDRSGAGSPRVMVYGPFAEGSAAAQPLSCSGCQSTSHLRGARREAPCSN